MRLSSEWCNIILQLLADRLASNAAHLGNYRKITLKTEKLGQFRKEKLRIFSIPTHPKNRRSNWLTIRVSLFYKLTIGALIKLLSSNLYIELFIDYLYLFTHIPILLTYCVNSSARCPFYCLGRVKDLARLLI